MQTIDLRRFHAVVTQERIKFTISSFEEKDASDYFNIISQKLKFDENYTVELGYPFKKPMKLKSLNDPEVTIRQLLSDIRQLFESASEREFTKYRHSIGLDATQYPKGYDYYRDPLSLDYENNYSEAVKDFELQISELRIEDNIVLAILEKKFKFHHHENKICYLEIL